MSDRLTRTTGADISQSVALDFDQNRLGIDPKNANNQIATSMLSNIMNLVKVIYPDYLADDAYANRRVMFVASERSNQHFDTDSLAQKMIEMTKSINEKVSGFFNDPTTGLDKSETFINMVSKAAVVLPLPDTLNDVQAHEWTRTEGVFYTLAKGVANSGKDALDNVIGYIPGAGDFAKKLASSVDLDTAIGAYSDASGVRKPLLDPNYWQNYTGSTPRTLTFEIHFLPSSQKEAQNVRDIIKIFKAYSSPALMDCGVALRAPYYWDIFIANAYISDMFRMDSLVLTNIAVQYGANDKMSLFADGMPKSIQLSLTFSEAHVTYMQNYTSDHISWLQKRVQ